MARSRNGRSSYGLFLIWSILGYGCSMNGRSRIGRSRYGLLWVWSILGMVGSGNGRVMNGLSRIGRSRIDTSTGSSLRLRQGRGLAGRRF
jgi:hypothetical protein